MKALFISHSAVPSGAELSMLRLLKVMRRVQPVALLTEDGPMIERLRLENVPVVTGYEFRVDISRGTTSIPGVVKAAAKLLRNGWLLGSDERLRDVDVVVARSIKSLVIGVPLARRLRKPLVWSVHDRISADYMGGVRSRMIRALGWFVADAYVANSKATLETITFGNKPHIVIYPGVDLGQFTPEPAKSDEADRPLVVVNIGRLAEWKGQHVFVEAFERACADSNVIALIVGGALFGEQDYETRLREQIREYRSADRIHLIGHVDDVKPYLQRADIVVHSSIIPEPFGSVIVEGMALGKAVIATRPGGPEEIIDAEQDGILIPGNDVDAMATAMKRLVDDEALRSALGQRALRSVHAFSVEEQAHRMETWLESWVK